MKRTHRASRNTAMILIAALILVITGGVLFLLATPLPGKGLGAAVPPPLPPGVSVGAVPDAAMPEIEHLTATVVADSDSAKGAVSGSYPNSPASLVPLASGWAQEQVAEFEKVSQDGDTLELAWSPILAAGPILGVELVATSTVAEATTITRVTGYADLKVDAAWSPQSLLSEDAAGVLSPLIRRAVKADELTSGDLGLDRFPTAEEAQEITRAGLDQLVFTADGVYLAFPGAPKALLLAEVDPALLTKSGARVWAAAHEGADFIGIPKVATGGGGVSTTTGATITFEISGDVDCTKAKCIALTFDDGPGEDTGRLLDTLAAADVQATFFLIGSHMQGQSGVVARMVNEGHIVGNHTWMHPSLPTVSKKQVDSQINRTREAITAAGAPTPRLFRPPYGALSDGVRQQIADLGYATILWDVDTLDWQHRDTKKTVAAALADARPGGIILMHDIYDSTVAAVPDVIKGLRAEGFTLVTVPELLGGSLKVGGVYRNNH